MTYDKYLYCITLKDSSPVIFFQIKEKNSNLNSDVNIFFNHSVIYVPDKEGHVVIPPPSPSQPSSSTTNADEVATINKELTSSATSPPFRRPKLDQCRFLSSSSASSK